MAAKKPKPKYSEEQTDLQNVLSTVAGRRLMWRLLDRGGVNSNPFVESSSDFTAYNCGALALAREFLSDILVCCPERYIQMIQEQNPGFMEPEKDEEHED